ncbi:MAG: NAD(P)H-hydrate dehydratase [Bacteroidales bacterium]|nr:NAD(P)H-hydrate dehydratase [Bacteroidales bacterium]
MKIFITSQIKEIDSLTITEEKIQSSDLMERASGQLFKWISGRFDRSYRFIILAGPGNNGGDSLALARMLSSNRYNAEVFFVMVSDKTSPDWKHNYERLKKETSVPFITLDSIEKFPVTGNGDVFIDAIFGSGLTRPAEGIGADVIRKVNQSDCTVISVDIPSGLFGEDNSTNNPGTIINAGYTLSFQFPKLSFLFPDTAMYAGEWHILPIGLSSNAIMNTPTPFEYLEESKMISLLKKRSKFDHKGIFGHGLLVAGSYGKMGAAVLGARAAMRTGIGLLTCHIPGCGYEIMQISVPEAMTRVDNNPTCITDMGDYNIFDSIGAGPGLGFDPATCKAFLELVKKSKKPMVIDADGINILGIEKENLPGLPANTVITPHVREFERIAGKSDNGFHRLRMQIDFAVEQNCIVVLKGAYTSIATPEGKVFFNSTGNPGMATAGSGDVLTGMILALLSRGYQPADAAVLGVWLHGLAGDLAAAERGQESVTASGIIDYISRAFVKSEEMNQ